MNQKPLMVLAPGDHCTYVGVSLIYPQKPWLNHTPHQMGVVFWGRGKGMASHTRGLPMSFPNSHKSFFYI